MPIVYAIVRVGGGYLGSAAKLKNELHNNSLIHFLAAIDTILYTLATLINGPGTLPQRNFAIGHGNDPSASL